MYVLKLTLFSHEVRHKTPSWFSETKTLRKAAHFSLHVVHLLSPCGPLARSMHVKNIEFGKSSSGSLSVVSRPV